MENYRSLPFAMYDLAVYLPGGAVFLVILRALFEAATGQSLHLESMPNGDDTISLIIRATVWLSASYLAGHLGAFLSTYVVEKFVHNSLGYPSDIWIKYEIRNAENWSGNILRQVFTENIARTKLNFVSIAIILAQIPAFIPILFFYIVKPFGFYSPKLPFQVLPAVRSQFEKLDFDINVKQGSRWEKVVEHFVANHCSLAYSRMYNYLVIYGALRILSLLLLILCWSFLVRDIYFKYNGGIVSWSNTFVYTALSCSYILAMMAFAKFNRRYFEETILAFVLAPSSLFSPRSEPRIRTL
jgi:hypothetical protein